MTWAEACCWVAGGPAVAAAATAAAATVRPTAAMPVTARATCLVKLWTPPGRATAACYGSNATAAVKGRNLSSLVTWGFAGFCRAERDKS